MISCLANCYSQESKNELQLKLGYNQGYFKDINYSPLNYTESGLLVTLAYDRTLRNNANLHFLLDFSSGVLSSEVSPYFDALPILANLEIGYLKSLKNTQNLQIRGGGLLFSKADMVFYDDTEAVTFTFLNGLALASNIEYSISAKHQFNSGISIPILFVLARPPFTGWDKEVDENADNPVRLITDGHITSLQDYIGINFKLGYQYRISERFTLTADYQLKYQSTEHRKSLTSLRNQFQIGSSFKF